eukprot:Skav211739  [mRNA]  locus=scaffold1548:87131:90439:+ [translate_table: standard]
MSQFQQLLDSLPLRIPELTIATDVWMWQHAISKLKGHTARGFDGLSAWEAKILPLEAIRALADSVLAYKQGLPSWLMKARTCPLSKVDTTPTSKQIRPITVLPLVFRIYAAVVCTQTLKSWHKYFPVQITGMLPTRGAHDAAYHSQILLEKAWYTRTSLSGVTLDLQKCFNMIWHQVGPRLLRWLGVPEQFVTRWMGSIANLKRYWDFQGCCFGPYDTNRGFPEGDSHSVLVMLGIAVLWVLLLLNQPSTSRHMLSPTAYADNWGWVTQDPFLHQHAATMTSLVVELCGLKVDWNKTWFFATSKSVANEAQSNLEIALPHQKLQRVHAAKDLGFHIRYSGCHHLGTRTDRYESALKRLQRLVFLPADSGEKEKMWLTSILPHAFYGAETCPPSKALLKQFRSKVADGIYGASQSMAPAVALLLGTRQILDPQYQLIVRALKAARRWLDNATQAHRESFFDMASNFQGALTAVHGPASALACYLRDINWHIDHLGYLHCGPFHDLHLYHDSMQRIQQWLTITWQDNLLARFTDRKQLFQTPAISRVDTVSLLNTFAADARGHLIREISGAYQTQTQKSKWNGDEHDTCAFCSMQDSRYHRIAECPQFAALREPYVQNLAWIKQHSDTFWDLPVMHVHDDDEVHRLLQFAEPAPVIAPAFFDLAKRRRDACLPLHLYTDGSSSYPKTPSTRIAAYAVALDVCESDEQRIHFAKQYLETSQMPPSFQLICQSRVRGEQTIGRAELSAIAIATRFPGHVITHTDSSCCIRRIEHLRHGTFDFLRGTHLDLAQDIGGQLHPEHVFRKVKAHQVISPDMKLLDIYRALGNQYVDEAAKAACAADWDAFARNQHARHAFQQEYRTHVHAVYELILQLQQARIQLESTAHSDAPDDDTLEAERHHTANLDQIAHYTLSGGKVQQVCDWGVCLYTFFPWGEQWAKSFQQWFCCLTWPGDDKIPKCCKNGVTWVELAVSLSMFAGQCLPILRDNCEGEKLLYFTRSVEDCVRFAISFTDQATTMQLMWGHFVHTVHPDMRPGVQRQLSKALIWLGHSQHCCGLSVRPTFFQQSRTVRYLSQNLHGKKSLDVPFRPTWLAGDAQTCDVAPWTA